MRKLVISFLFLIISLPMFAIEIINENKNTVKYKIADAATCVAMVYNKGEISKGGSVFWTENTYYRPDSVCVWAAGYTSTVGSYAYNLKNKGCVVRVIDRGFMKGVKIKPGTGC